MPSNTFYNHIISNNLLTNTEIAIDDVIRADHIFGPPKPLLQGQMTRLKLITNKIEKIPLTTKIAQQHTTISISVNFFWVNGLAFLTSKSKKINFVTAKYQKSRSAKFIINTLNKIRQMYKSRGFCIENIHGVNEPNKD